MQIATKIALVGALMCSSAMAQTFKVTFCDSNERPTMNWDIFEQTKTVRLRANTAYQNPAWIVIFAGSGYQPNFILGLHTPLLFFTEYRPDAGGLFDIRFPDAFKGKVYFQGFRVHPYGFRPAYNTSPVIEVEKT